MWRLSKTVTNKDLRKTLIKGTNSAERILCFFFSYHLKHLSIHLKYNLYMIENVYFSVCLWKTYREINIFNHIPYLLLLFFCSHPVLYNEYFAYLLYAEYRLLLIVTVSRMKVMQTFWYFKTFSSLVSELATHIAFYRIYSWEEIGITINMFLSIRYV